MARLRSAIRILLSKLLLLVSLVHAQLLPNLPATGSNTASDTLTLHMSYCSECYPTAAEATRRAACHRLALGKFFSAECTQTPNAPCVATSAQTITASFSTLNTPASNPRVGLEDTLQCRLFSSQFITPTNSVLDARTDPEVASDSLAQTLQDALRDAIAQIVTVPILPGEDIIESTVVEVLFDKPRPSGIPDRAPDLASRLSRLVLDPELTAPSPTLGNLTARSATADHLNLHDVVVDDVVVDEDDDDDGSSSGGSGGGGTEGVGVLVGGEDLQVSRGRPAQTLGLGTMLEVDPFADNPFGLAPLAPLAQTDVELPTVVRQAGQRRPKITKITITFSRPVRPGRVSQVFRRLLRLNYVLRVYRQGYRIARVNPRKYRFYAYFSENYRRVFNTLRPQFA